MAASRHDLPSLIDSPAGSAPARRPAADTGGNKPDRRQLLLGVGAGVILLVSLGLLASMLGGGAGPGEASRRRVVIDAESGEVFEDFRVKDGSAYPLRNPKTGADTLYPAEACFWNRDGTAKLTPTYVFVKSYRGDTGETRCPDCNRVVVPHNPMPPDDVMLAAIEQSKQTSGN